MTLKNLLRELENVPHDARIKRMVGLGKEARTNAQTAALIQTLRESDGFFERFLALASCWGSGNGDHVFAALSDPSRLLRGFALRLVPYACSDAQATDALIGLPRQAQTKLLRLLVKRKRRPAVDGLLRHLQQTGDMARLGTVLPFGSDAGIAGILPTVAPRFGETDWRRLVLGHPRLVFQTLLAQTNALAEPDARLLRNVKAVLPTLAYLRPDDVQTLLRAVLRFEPLSTFTLTPRQSRSPNELADLVLATEDKTNASFVPVAHQLTTDRLLVLLEKRPELLPPGTHWLLRLPPDVRSHVFAQAGNGWRDSDAIVGAEIVSVLPGAVRENEARRHLALPSLATRPAQRMPYAAFLPFDEAKAAVDPFLRSPNADYRGYALTALIGCACYHRDRLSDVLVLVRARNNEQDPVRGVMLSALASLPPSRWQAAHLPDLGQIVRDALDAADLSPSTASHAERLVVSLLPFHPQWASQWLGTLVKERGQVHFTNLADRLTDADTRRIAPFLLPVFKSWETRERDRNLVSAAQSFGRRLEVFDGLVEILERVSYTSVYSTHGILTVLQTYRPDRFALLVPALLKRDASVGTLHPVYQFLHTRRQDLLTPYLGRKAWKGRFSTGNTRLVLPLTDGFYRWTPTQQKLFAETLTEAVEDIARDTPSVHQTITQLAALPSVVPAVLLALAKRETPPAVRDAALRALAHVDAGQGVPVLIEALSDSRARIAIYALRSALLEMPPSRALDLLRNVPTSKVAVAKEVVRLLGDLDTPGAYPVLLQMARQTDPPLHRDVQVALLRALWEHLEQNETWPVLQAAAQNPDPAIAGGVVSIPDDRLSPVAQTRLLNLIVLLLSHPDPILRVNVLGRCAFLPLADPDRRLLPRLVECLQSLLPDESKAAAEALLDTYAGRDGQVVGDAVVRVRSNRRVLYSLLIALSNRASFQRETFLPAVRAALSALAGDVFAATLRVALASANLPANELVPFLVALANTNELHAEATIKPAEGVFYRRTADLPALETALAASPDDRLRRIALAALLAQSAQSAGWTPALRARLADYQNDPSPLVAGAAQFVFPPLD